MPRNRPGQRPTRMGLALCAAAIALLGLTSLVLSPSVISDAGADLLRTPPIHDPVVAELARVAPGVYPPGAVSGDLAGNLGERMVRDRALIAEITSATREAHSSWKQGHPALLELDPDVVTPAALAAMRDVDLSLSRAFPAHAVIAPDPIAVTVPVSAKSVATLRTAALFGFIAGLVGVVVGGLRTRRVDVLLTQIGNAALSLGVATAAVALLVWAVDLHGWDWPLSALFAVVTAARRPVLMGAAAASLLGIFLRAAATQVVPTTTRSRRRRPASAPVFLSRLVGRWQRRQVRQEAIEAFFDEDQSAEPDRTPELEVSDHPVLTRPEAGHDGFEGAIAAVERDPGAPRDSGQDPDSGPAADDGEKETDAAAAERREALERIDGARSRLRTHLPR